MVHTAWRTSFKKFSEPARGLRTTKATSRFMLVASPSKLFMRTGQYTELDGSSLTPSSYTFATTPTISRQSSVVATRMRLPRALRGSCQYSRAKFSEMRATGSFREGSDQAKAAETTVEGNR